MAGGRRIYLSKYAGWYSVRDEAYYDESEPARATTASGSRPTGTPVEWVEEESYFFRLSAYTDRLLAHYEADPDFVHAGGVHERDRRLRASAACRICRSPAPPSTGASRCPAIRKHVMYVWVDALTNYITATGFPDTEASVREFWPADVHVIGKDIMRFHAIYWPAFLMSAGIAAAEADCRRTAFCSTAARKCGNRSAM